MCHILSDRRQGEASRMRRSWHGLLRREELPMKRRHSCVRGLIPRWRRNRPRARAHQNLAYRLAEISFLAGLAARRAPARAHGGNGEKPRLVVVGHLLLVMSE